MHGTAVAIGVCIDKGVDLLVKYLNQKKPQPPPKPQPQPSPKLEPQKPTSPTPLSMIQQEKAIHDKLLQQKKAERKFLRGLK